MKKIKDFFLKQKTHIPKGSCYAVLRGDYFGEIFVFFHQEKDFLYFVSLPKMLVREVKINKFEIGLNDKILDPIKTLPKKIYDVVEKHGKNTMSGLNTSNE
jgi:hypothetical protein